MTSHSNSMTRSRCRRPTAALADKPARERGGRAGDNPSSQTSAARKEP